MFLFPSLLLAQQPILLNHPIEPPKDEAPALASPAAPAVIATPINAGTPIPVPFACAEEDLRMAGLLCTGDDPCPIYLELSAVAPAGKKLFLAGDIHAISATLSSILLSSDDGGATWKEPFARIPGSALEDLQFYDPQHGWASGETQYPLPRDPFFLLSTDGGVSWKQHPVTEDGAPGAVQRFWFDSPRHGELIVDAGRNTPGGRYISYESQTGGDSWTVRSTTAQLPKLKRAPLAAENPDYRIHPDKATNALRIEKRQGDKWEPIASFLIEVARCTDVGQALPPAYPQ
ncbi:MAG: hypothetical protein ABSB15_10465 [Bryobacteraceae bacterium]